VVVPPALPAAMTIGIVHSMKRLKRLKIYCTCQTRINVAGKIKLVCFDKVSYLNKQLQFIRLWFNYLGHRCKLSSLLNKAKIVY